MAIKRYVFNLKNIKTYPYEYKYINNKGPEREPILAYNQYIDYGDVKVNMSITGDSYYGFKTNINWVHPASSYICKKRHIKNLCLGGDYTYQMNMAVRKNDKDRKKIIEHILYDYFSTCTKAHWDKLYVPSNVEFITNDDLFLCPYYKKYKHISQKSLKFQDYSLAFERVFLSYTQNTSGIFPIDISNHRYCFHCGALSEPKSQSCFLCRRSLKESKTFERYIS